jgi:hypothetical protein
MHRAPALGVGANRVFEVEHCFPGLAGVGFELTATIQGPTGKIVGVTGDFSARLAGQRSPA